MTFADCAARLCGLVAFGFGWRPTEFWEATPAELVCLLTAWRDADGAASDGIDARTLQQLKERFPDG
jgi:hypothetical protein